jgi:hypothetical protein
MFAIFSNSKYFTILKLSKSGRARVISCSSISIIIVVFYKPKIIFLLIIRVVEEETRAR